MGIIDSLTKNPSLLGLAALGIGLFVFRDKISGFFSDITGGAKGTAQIAETGGILAGNLTSNLTGIQDILSGKIFEGFEFPSFDFSDFEFPDLSNLFPGLGSLGTQDVTTTPAAIGRASNRGRTMDVVKTLVPEIAILENLNVQTGLDTGQQFQGGGTGFIGGAVSEIPLERQSLGDIINNLGVSASRAASLRAEAIGFTREEQSFLNMGQEISPLGDLGPQTSDVQFQGMTPQEIALRLTGGNISNF